MHLNLYDLIVFIHILLFVFWLGADMGVAVLGEHFRKRGDYSIQERVALLKLLTIVDMFPRSAWALMVPVSLTLVHTGGYWMLSAIEMACVWLIGVGWLFLVWVMHLYPDSPHMSGFKQLDYALKYLLAASYVVIGGYSLAHGAPLAENWLALKALVFGLIFLSAIMIDIRFRDLHDPLARLIAEGSTDAVEAETLGVMNRTRFWVRMVYALVVIAAFLGTTKLI